MHSLVCITENKAYKAPWSIHDNPGRER